MTANIWNEAKTLKELTRQVAYVLPELGWYLTTAESCTGGNLASALCAEEDTAAFFSTGVVTFSDEAKHNVLGVRYALSELLRRIPHWKKRLH